MMGEATILPGARPEHDLFPFGRQDDPMICQAAERLRGDLASRRSLRRVTAEVDGGNLVLRGSVNSFYDRQLCLCWGQRACGSARLVDRIEVAWPEGS